MASRLSESADLAERCRKAGWEVTRSNGTSGWKVKSPTGFSLVIHGTYSDSRSMANTLSDLKRAGLVDDEEAVKSARLTETRTRAQAAKAAAEKRGKELAAQASIVKAAGPYLVEAEDIDLEWLVGPHPAPWMKWAKITPQIAREVLDKHNGDNRPLGPNTVSFYRDIILARMWKLTHQGVAFDSRGQFQDGQHRFQALVEAHELDPDIDGLPFAVFVGMPVENFKAIDEGRLRNARQLFARGGEKNHSALQTTVRLVHYVNDADARRAMRLRMPNQVVLDEFNADAEKFRDAVDYGMSTARKLHCSPGALAAAYYLITKRHAHVDGAYVDEFFAGLVEGKVPGTRYKLDDTDPREVLRRRFADLKLKTGKERRSSLSQVGMIIASWNNCVLGRFPRTLYFSDDAPIPQILTCDPAQGATPAAFQRNGE